MSSLFIVSCSATKSRALATTPLPARDAYTGQAFRMARQVLERNKLKWCILSASYGFLWPDTLIEHYDEKMLPVTAATVWDDCFGSITDSQYGRLFTADRYVSLGSRLYADAAAALLQREVEAPMAGLPIGRMLSSIAHGTWHHPTLQLI